MSKTYEIDKQANRHRLKLDIVILVTVLVLVSIVIIYIIFDLRSSGPAVNNDNNVPVLGSIEFEERLKTEFTEDEFALRLPEDWVRIEERRTSGILKAPGFEAYEYKGVNEDNAGRVLQIYVDKIPSEFPVTYLVEVEPTAVGGLTPISLSEHCSGFTVYDSDRSGQSVPSKWNGHNFVCNTIDYINIEATVVNDIGDGTIITGPNQEHRYLFVYTDHGSSPDSSLFFDILKSFQSK